MPYYMTGVCQSCGNPSSYLTRNDVELYGVEHKGILLCPPCLADANPITEKTNKYGINEKMSYTIDEIQHILNKSRSQICIMCKTNKLKGAFKGPEHGTPWYIPGAAIVKYIEENEKQEEMTETKKDARNGASLKAPRDGGIDPKATYTPLEAAKLVGRTRQWAALACRKKWLPGAIKISGNGHDQWLIPGVDLMNYIQAVGNKSKLCPRKLDRDNEAEPEPEPVDDSPVAMLTKRVEALEADLNRLRALLHDA